MKTQPSSQEDLLQQIELFEELMKDDLDELMERFESVKTDLGIDVKYPLSIHRTEREFPVHFSTGRPARAL